MTTGDNSDNSTPETTRRHNRRAVIRGAGKAAFLGTVGMAAAVTTSAKAQAAQNGGQLAVTVLYKNGEGTTFDFEYYKNNHIALIDKLFGDAIDRIELRQGQAAQDGSAPPYIAVVSIWIADPEAYQAAAAEHSQTLIDDVPNFTNAEVVIQTDTVYAVSG